MILIYINKTSPRLQYTAAFIFKGILKIPYALTSHAESFKKFEEVKINYTAEKIADDELRIPNSGLLHETGINERSIDVFEVNGSKAFFGTPSTGNNDYPFDIFAAAFYLVSRYEEYLPHEKDKYGRYLHTNSLAYKENFLHLPLINTWLKDLIDSIRKKNENFKYDPSERGAHFKFIPTYDIDIAYSYLNKGIYRNSGGIFRSLFTLNVPSLVERLKVLSGTKKDPFDNYARLDELHKNHDLHPVYFFLVAEKNGTYDKNILPHVKAMQELIKEHAEKYSIGLHPSWQSEEGIDVLKKEKAILENISQTEIKKSRQHYIHFNLPATLRKVIDAGLTDEYSMGYAGSNGFRASVANTFYWYDLEKDEQTSLKVHPFCYMDSTAIYQQNLATEDAYNEILHYYNECKKVHGTFITIFHNHLLGADKTEWRDVYEKFLDEVL